MPNFTSGPWGVFDIWRRESPSGTMIGPQEYPVCAMTGYYGPDQTPANARLIAAAPDILAACKAQHEAIDILFARLIQLDPTFFPSKSGLPWEAAASGHAAIAKATGA